MGTSDEADEWPYDGIRRVATIGGNRRCQTGDNAPAAESFIDAKCGIVVQTRVKYRVSMFGEIPPQSALLETAHAPRFWRQGGGAQPVHINVAGARFGVNTRSNPSFWPKAVRRWPAEVQSAKSTSIKEKYLKDVQAFAPLQDTELAFLELPYQHVKLRLLIHLEEIWQIQEMIMQCRKLAPLL